MQLSLHSKQHGGVEAEVAQTILFRYLGIVT